MLQIPRRFSICALLALVAIVAMTLFLIRDYKTLQYAREEFRLVAANYEAGRVLSDDVVTASKRLMTAESAMLWISNRAATDAHIERLQNLLAKVQSPTSESQPQDIQRRVEFIQQELQRYP